METQVDGGAVMQALLAQISELSMQLAVEKATTAALAAKEKEENGD